MPAAARIGDQHTCPKVTGYVSHVGGPVPEGCPSVLIGKAPAARVGDMVICVGPPDAVASTSGSATVLIGGKVVARVGDTTDHKGVISGPGCPTVILGG